MTDLSSANHPRVLLFRVTSVRDGREHLVRDEGMTPGRAGRFPALCGRTVWAAMLTCPAGPPCPACFARRIPATAKQRQRHRKPRRGVWAWLNPLRRRHSHAAELPRRSAAAALHGG